MRHSLLIGMFLLPLTASAQSQSSSEESMYMRIRSAVESTMKVSDVDAAIVQAADELAGTEELPLDQKRIRAAQAGDFLTLCTPDSGQSEAPPSSADCDRLLRNVAGFVEDTVQQRDTLRALRAEAVGMEDALRTDGSNGGSMLRTLLQLLTLWLSDSDRQTAPRALPAVYTAVVNEQALEKSIEALGEALDDLVGDDDSTDRIAGAAERYRWGLGVVVRREGEKCAAKILDPELRYLFERPCGVEDALRAYGKAVRNDPRYTGDLLLYPLHDIPGKAKELGVSVWVRGDDVGLTADAAGEPMHIALDCKGVDNPGKRCKDDVTLGGTYPPDPLWAASATPLCNDPVLKAGYLCSTALQTTCFPAEFQEGNPETGLTIVPCMSPPLKNFLSFSNSGPDMCEVGGWVTAQPQPIGRDKQGNVLADSAELQPELHPASCMQCVPDAYCASKCEEPTVPVSGTQRVPLCIDEDVGAFSRYILISQLVAAQRVCGSDIATDPRTSGEGDSCCPASYNGQLAACNAMAQDGVLKDDVRTCAAILSSLECTGWLPSCLDGTLSPAQCSFVVKQNPQSCLQKGVTVNAADLVKGIRDRVTAKDLLYPPPTTCAAAVAELNPASQSPDGRLLRMESSLQDVCNPGCAVAYGASIGNGMCALAQCTEQSLEEHRIDPGRSGAQTEDSAFPWEGMRGTGGPVLDAIRAGWLSTPLPERSLLTMLRTLDAAVCQVNGLPPLTPSSRCLFQTVRRTNQPALPIRAVAEGIGDQRKELQVPQEHAEAAIAAVGMREGRQLLRGVLNQQLPVLSALVQSAADQLKLLGQVRFPSQMCPRNTVQDPLGPR